MVETNDDVPPASVGRALADARERIHTDPAILVGKPVIRGSRISVELILRRLAAGEPEESIMHGFMIELEDIRACLAYAADRVKRLPRRLSATRNPS